MSSILNPPGSSSPVTLLKSASGTDTNASPANVDTIAISGLTAKDTLRIYLNVSSVAQQTATPVVRNDTDGVICATVGAAISAGAVGFFTATIRQHQNGPTAVDGLMGGSNNGVLVNNLSGPTFTAWTGAWTLALRHGGVTAGGTFRWSWAVYKMAGQ